VFMIEKCTFPLGSTKKMLQSPSAVEDWLNEDNDFNTSGYFRCEVPSREDPSISGTVCVNTVNSPSNSEAGVPIHLNDMFAGNINPTSLQNLFVEPKSEEKFRRGEAVVTPRDLFKDNRNTLTKSRLSGIIATLDSQSQPCSDQLFSWPVGTKNSAHSSITPTASLSNAPVTSEKEEYPHDIDFLEDSNDNPSSHQDKMEDERVIGSKPEPIHQTTLQNHRHPKSTPISKSQANFFPQSSYKDASESAIHQQSISNMQHPVSSLFAEDIKYSSIRSETSLLDLQQHFISAPPSEGQATRNIHPMIYDNQEQLSVVPKEILSHNCSKQESQHLEYTKQRYAEPVFDE
jgi:hypothetical protein